MLRGLEGRRIALVTVGDDQGHQARVDTVRRALEQAGAQIDALSSGQGPDETWHGGRYAGLVVIGGDSGVVSKDARLMQLIREFLVSEKPIAAHGDALDVIIQAEGAGGTAVTMSDADASLFAAQLVRQFAERLEEHDVDEMSEQSFPASDPPATTPGSIGPAAGPDSDTRA